MELPNYILDVEDDKENIVETSYVLEPATGKAFALFSEDTKQEFKVIKEYNQFERITSGVWMMPDTKYYRNNNGYEFTVEFTKETLKRALMKYLKSGNYDKVKVEHQGKKLEGFTTIEHWVIEGPDTKSPVLGLSLEDLGYSADEIPVGTVMKSTFVSDIDFWNDYVLTGKVRGFSIGGLFNFNPELKKSVFSALGLVQASGTLETDKGRVTINSDKTDAENGIYTLSTGFSFVVEDGVVVDYGDSITLSTDNFSEAEATVEVPATPEVEQAPTEQAETSANEVVENNREEKEEIAEEVETSEDESTEASEAPVEEPTDSPDVDPQVSVEKLLEEQREALEAQLNELRESLNSKDEEIATLKQKIKESPIKRTSTNVTNNPYSLGSQAKVVKTVNVGGKLIEIKK